MRIVCLASGGIDSSVLMLMLKNMNHEVFPLFVNYGQKAEKIEYVHFHKVCKFLKLEPEIIDVSGLGKLSIGLTNQNLLFSDDPFFPARNLLLLTIGLQHAYTKSIRVVSIGSLGNSVFPDQTKQFLSGAEIALNSSVREPIKILSPLIDLNKREVVELAKKYGLPLELTYSCHIGTLQPCGQCMGCKERKSVEKFSLED